MGNKNLKARLDKLDKPSPPVPKRESLLEQISRESDQHDRENRLALFWWMLKRASLCDDERISANIREEAHRCYRQHWSWYDRDLTEQSAKYLLQEIENRQLTPEHVWQEFACYLPFPKLSLQPEPQSKPDVAYPCVRPTVQLIVEG